MSRDIAANLLVCLGVTLANVFTAIGARILRLLLAVQDYQTNTFEVVITAIGHGIRAICLRFTLLGQEIQYVCTSRL